MGGGAKSRHKTLRDRSPDSAHRVPSGRTRCIAAPPQLDLERRQLIPMLLRNALVCFICRIRDAPPTWPHKHQWPEARQGKSVEPIALVILRTRWNFTRPVTWPLFLWIQKRALFVHRVSSGISQSRHACSQHGTLAGTLSPKQTAVCIDVVPICKSYTLSTK